LEGVVIKVKIWYKRLLKTNTPLLLLLHLHDTSIGTPRSVWWWSGWTSWASWWKGWLFRVSSQFGVPHGWTSCAPHATEGQRAAPWWCYIFLHASGRLGDRVPPQRAWWWCLRWLCLLGEALVAIFHIVVALTHTECIGGCLLVGKTHKRSISRVEFIMVNSLYYYCWRVVSEVHKLGWILSP
jgi:hypothetical protein